MEKISCFLTLNHTHLSQPYIKSIDFFRDEGENKQNMLIFVSGCSTPLKANLMHLTRVSMCYRGMSIWCYSGDDRFYAEAEGRGKK